MRELARLEESGVLSESTTQEAKSRPTKKELLDLLGKLKEKYTKHFYEKFPKAQYDDVEEAIRSSIEKTLDGDHVSSYSAGKFFKRSVHDSLSGLHAKKRKAKKNLSCVKVLKSLGSESSLSSLMKRAEKILTSQERKIIGMCSQGKSVRAIGYELGISSATAWRSLNDGLDKIRLSHGIRPRKLGRS